MKAQKNIRLGDIVIDPSYQCRMTVDTQRVADYADAMQTGSIFPPLIIEKKMDFWQAMETSRKVVTKNIFELSIFMLVLYIFLFVGVLLLLVGFFVALPIVFAAIAYAYCDLIGLEEPPVESGD